jgi:hypothetical protein
MPAHAPYLPFAISVRVSSVGCERPTAQQIDEKVEHLGFERDQFGPEAQFVSLGIEHVIVKPENPPCPWPGPSARFFK